MGTATGTATPMHTDDLLTLAQWLSPSFPVGAFAYSHGLESAVADGWVHDAATLHDWLADVLAEGTGRSDAVLLGAAHRAGPGELADIDAHARAFAASRERRIEAERLGAAFTAATNAVWGLELPPLTYPVAVGAAAGRRGIDAETAAALYLQASASNLVQAAQRLMPLGQTAGQRILADLSGCCRPIARAALATDLDDLASCAFRSDIAAMRHETLQPRIFTT